MKVAIPGILALAILAGCDGNPFTTVPTDPATGGGDGIHNVDLPPGTEDPSSKSDITRTEAQDNTAGSATYGNGYVSDYQYNAGNDTFSVDGLAFDGGNVYKRGKKVGSVNGFAVYEADSTYADSVTGTPIDQFSHRALYGVSKTGKTAFAIVRTGAYIPYGFGGFIYQRTGGVTLPTSGQAHYAGDYAAIRDFSGTGGLEYADGQMTVDIDFADFDAGNGVKGYVTDRHIYDINGNDVTDAYIAAMNASLTPGQTITEIPTLVFAVGPGAMDANGEISGSLSSNYIDSSGAAATFETGVYYAVVAGDATTANSEVAGIIVVTSTDPFASGVEVRETGGFVLYRK
jgi:hypothetical protein